jgi:hypothetical protein
MEPPPSPPKEDDITQSAAELLRELRKDGSLAELLKGAAHQIVTKSGTALASDMLYGAAEIADFLYGPGKTKKRKVYRLIKAGHLPHFRLGAGLCARRSVLIRWIIDEEARRIRERE